MNSVGDVSGRISERQCIVHSLSFNLVFLIFILQASAGFRNMLLLLRV